MAIGRLAIMGNINVVDPDGQEVNYPKALLISFDSSEELWAAIIDMELTLTNYHDETHKA